MTIFIPKAFNSFVLLGALIFISACTSTVDSTASFDQPSEEERLGSEVPAPTEENFGTNALSLTHFNSVIQSLQSRTGVYLNLRNRDANPERLEWVYEDYHSLWKGGLSPNANPYSFSPSTGLSVLALAHSFCSVVGGVRTLSTQGSQRYYNANNFNDSALPEQLERIAFWEASGLPLGQAELSDGEHRPGLTLASEEQRLAYINFMLDRFLGPEVVPTAQREDFRTEMLAVMEGYLNSGQANLSQVHTSLNALVLTCVPALAVSVTVK